MSSLNSLPSRTLRRLYLTLFLRGRSSRGLRLGRQPKSISQKLFGVLALYFLIGAIGIAAIQRDVFLSGFFLHAMAMLFTGMFIAASAGEMLFNKDEAEILGHRPVDPRQLLWAKVAVLIQVSVLMAVAYSLPGCFRAVTTGLGGVLFPFAHLVSVVMAAVLMTGGVVMLYQLCLRWFGRQRLDNLMTGAQVLLTVGLVLGSQMIRPLITGQGTLGVLKEAWWGFLIPPAWFAGLDAVLTGNFQLEMIVLALLAIISTLTVGAFAFGKLADATQEELVVANETAAPVVAPGILEGSAAKSDGRRSSWIDRLVAIPPLSLALRHPVVRASFRLCMAYMFRDRDTKLRLYPGVAPIMIMPLVVLFGKVGGQSGFGLAFAASYIGLLPTMTLNLLQFSQDWQAADIFRLGPAGGPGHFIRGSLLAICLVFVAPASVILMGAAAFMHGTYWHSMLQMLPGLIALPAYAFLAGETSRAVPLSRPTEESKSAGRGAKMMLLMLSAIAIGTGGYFADSSGDLIPFLIVEAVVSLVVCLLANASISKVTWDPVE
jgi:hypothetical protein